MKYTTIEIGKLVRDTRKALGVSQHDLALTSGTGQRFISELENGKPTCQLEKVLVVLQTLGINISLHSPMISKADIIAGGNISAGRGIYASGDINTLGYIKSGINNEKP